MSFFSKKNVIIYVLNISRIYNEALYGDKILPSSCFVSDEINKIKEIVEFNYRGIYSDLKYNTHECNFNSDDFNTLEILRAIRFWGFPFKLYSGYAYMPFYPDLSGNISYRKDSIFKISDDFKGLSCELRVDLEKNCKICYVLFFKRTKELQGNYFEFKHFIINQIKPIFFDFLQYKSITGRAIYSTNSEIKNIAKPDWRLKEKVWKLKDGTELKVSGLKYLYLKMGFELGELVDPSLDPHKDYVVLLNKNI